jgi:membrane protein DedA with SNARE-associated domain
MDLALIWISQYGYAALFLLIMLGIVGLPIPDETLLAFAGYLVFKDKLALFPTIVSGFLGSVCGITVSYVLGRSLGSYFVERFGPMFRFNPDHMEWVRRWFVRRGKLLLVFGYFIPGVRHFTALVAGSSGLGWKTFALFAYIGALLWSVSFISLGYVLEERWSGLSGTIQYILVVVIGVFFVLAGSYLLIRRLRRSRSV